MRCALRRLRVVADGRTGERGINSIPMPLPMLCRQNNALFARRPSCLAARNRLRADILPPTHADATFPTALPPAILACAAPARTAAAHAAKRRCYARAAPPRAATRVSIPPSRMRVHTLRWFLCAPLWRRCHASALLPHCRSALGDRRRLLRCNMARSTRLSCWRTKRRGVFRCTVRSIPYAAFPSL